MYSFEQPSGGLQLAMELFLEREQHSRVGEILHSPRSKTLFSGTHLPPNPALWANTTSQTLSMGPLTLVYEGNFTATIFHLFLRLIAELRAKVCKFALEAKRGQDYRQTYGINGRILEFYNYYPHGASVDISEEAGGQVPGVMILKVH